MRVNGGFDRACAFSTASTALGYATFGLGPAAARWGNEAARLGVWVGSMVDLSGTAVTSVAT